jgi:hypothetical protein
MLWHARYLAFEAVHQCKWTAHAVYVVVETLKREICWMMQKVSML